MVPMVAGFKLEKGDGVPEKNLPLKATKNI
jgi:hypothetical protein